MTWLLIKHKLYKKDVTIIQNHTENNIEMVTNEDVLEARNKND